MLPRDGAPQARCPRSLAPVRLCFFLAATACAVRARNTSPAVVFRGERPIRTPHDIVDLEKTNKVDLTHSSEYGTTKLDVHGTLVPRFASTHAHDRIRGHRIVNFTARISCRLQANISAAPHNRLKQRNLEVSACSIIQQAATFAQSFSRQQLSHLSPPT